MVQGLEVQFADGPRRRATIPSGLDVGLTVVSQNPANVVLTAVGILTPLQVGDREFDEKFSVRAIDHAGAARALTPEVRAALLALSGLIDLEIVEDDFRFELPESDLDAGAALSLAVQTVHLMRDALGS